ncbi:MAG TPA: hypothetical protein VE863_04315, partial [Pyrinomonadaceae bacterium]|nr:hypothetical protein [Pyrinomonadaceae bacterium]
MSPILLKNEGYEYYRISANIVQRSVAFVEDIGRLKLSHSVLGSRRQIAEKQFVDRFDRPQLESSVQRCLASLRTSGPTP